MKVLYKVSPTIIPSGPLEGQLISIQLFRSSAIPDGNEFPPLVEIPHHVSRMLLLLSRYSIATLFPLDTIEPGQQSQTTAVVAEYPLALTSGEKVFPKSIDLVTTHRASPNVELNFMNPTIGFPAASTVTVGNRAMLSPILSTFTGAEKFISTLACRVH